MSREPDSGELCTERDYVRTPREQIFLFEKR